MLKANKQLLAFLLSLFLFSIYGLDRFATYQTTMLSFLSPSKLVQFTPEAIKIPKGRFKHNMVCGSAKSRKNVKKEGLKYKLKEVLKFPPLTVYAHRYVCQNRTVTQLGADGTEKVVKKWFEWHLKPEKKNRYIYYTKMPKQMEPFFDYVPDKKPTKKTFEQKELKTLSVRSKNKIGAKIQSWYFDELYKHNFDQTKVNFKMFTFTVTEREFSHEKTNKAWVNFLQRMYNVNGQKWHYLWVAELQDGKRNKEKAEYYRALAQKNIQVNELWSRWLVRRAIRYENKKPTNNVHYHLITDRYYDITILNHYWLTALKNQGAKWHNKKGRKYNPVEISKPSNKGWQGLQSYLTKYISKNDRALRVPLWNCNAYVSAFATSVLKATDMSRYCPPIQMEEGSDLILCSIEKSKRVLKNGAVLWRCLRSKNRVYIDKVKGLAIYYFNKLTQGLKNALHPLFEFNRQTALGLSPTPFFMCN